MRPTAVRAVIGVFAVIVLGVVAASPIPGFATSTVTQTIAEWLGIFLSVIVQFLGKLLLLVIYVLTLVAQYNSFVTSTAVTNGWVIVRDIANMFFIVALLVIAFGTILSVKEYQVQTLLPKLVFGAIFINFSKTIAGIFIDLSQVAMMTFVNGFAAAAAGNFAQAFQLQQMISLTYTEGAGVDILKVVGTYLLAAVLLAIALATCVVMTVILAYRIVMLWALVVLSPLPYLLNAIPQGKKYASEWWSEFGKYLTTGPVLAFFLWLALVTAGSGQTGTEIRKDATVGGSDVANQEYNDGVAALGSSAGTPDSIISFVIAISMLIAGLQIGAKTGAMGSKMLGGIVDKTKEYGTKAAKKAAVYGTGYAAARAVATRGVQSDWAQNRLGAVAASRIPLANNLAMRGLVAVGAARKKREEEQANRIAQLKGKPKELEMLGRLANQAAVGANAVALRDAARRRAPSTIKDAALRKATVGKLKDDQLLDLSANELYELQTRSDLSAGQRRTIFEKGTAVQQRAVGDLGNFQSHQKWLSAQEEREYQTQLRSRSVHWTPTTTDAQKDNDRAEARRDAKMATAGAMPGSPTIPPWQNPPPGGGPPPPPGPRPRYSAGYDAQRQQQTQRQVQDHANRGLDFFASKEYQQNASKYYSREQYHENDRTSKSIERHREREGYDPNAISGLQKLLRQAEQGGGSREARLAIDFNMLGLSGNGVHLTGGDKDRVAQQIGTVLQGQGYADADIEKIKNALSGSSALNLVNKGRDTGSAKHTVIHESIHGQLESVDQTQLRSVWESIATQERESIVNAIRSEWKNPQMSEEDAMHEYFTDGLANATRWAREGGVKLSPEAIAQLKGLGVRLSPRRVAGTGGASA
ncbi:hypothetical protein HYV74_03000 [Candidatus Uhrbacteria bacterium]|nr:hypothetical protein [Candidatus Uhrbacteria bacterium]